MGCRVSEDELQQALDSCGKPFAYVGKNAVSLRLHLLICTQYDNKKTYTVWLTSSRSVLVVHTSQTMPPPTRSV